MRSLLAGLAIGIGGTAFLASDSKLVGAVLFGIGLYMVCFFKLALFTGKVCYIRGTGYLARMLICNFTGAGLMGAVIRFARTELVEKAGTICQAKLAEGWRLLPLGILCNVLIFVAVESYSKNQYGLFLAVTVFIMCGFEHCIANAFYFAVAAEPMGVPYVICNAICNAVGGIMCRRCSKNGRKID